jgi:hypothetical protein
MTLPVQTMQHRERPLTMVEGLLILAILIVLGGFILSSMNEAGERNHSATCIANLQQLSRAFAMYTQDWHGYFPSNLPKATRRHEWESPWPSQIAKHVRDKRAFRCPDDPTPVASDLTATSENAHSTSYILNRSIGWHRSGAWAGNPIALKLSEIKTPQSTMLLADREGWHFARSIRDKMRFVLFVDGRVERRRDDDVQDKYFGQLGSE